MNYPRNLHIIEDDDLLLNNKISKILLSSKKPKQSNESLIKYKPKINKIIKEKKLMLIQVE